MCVYWSLKFKKEKKKKEKIKRAIKMLKMFSDQRTSHLTES